MDSSIIELYNNKADFVHTSLNYNPFMSIPLSTTGPNGMRNLFLSPITTN